MKNFSKIIAFLWVLISGAAGGTSPVNAYDAGQHSKENAPAIHSANNPNLFAIHHEKKTGANLFDNLPKSNSADHSQNNAFGSQSAESALQKQTAIYLRFSKTIDCSLTVRKLIFPFHSHL